VLLDTAGKEQQREADLCGLRCHDFPQSSVTEVASQRLVEYGDRSQYRRLPTKRRDSHLWCKSVKRSHQIYLYKITMRQSVIKILMLWKLKLSIEV